MKLARLLYIYSLLVVWIFVAGSCNKIKEDIGKQFIINVMTDGRWIVNKFTEDGTVDITHSFDGYEFQFTADGKVYGFYNTSQEVGTWEGNTNNLTITSDFPGAGDPLRKLNGVWKISNNTKTSVEASPFNSSRIAFLKLVKKS